MRFTSKFGVLQGPEILKVGELQGSKTLLSGFENFRTLKFSNLQSFRALKLSKLVIGTIRKRSFSKLEFLLYIYKVHCHFLIIFESLVYNLQIMQRGTDRGFTEWSIPNRCLKKVILTTIVLKYIIQQIRSLQQNYNNKNMF